MSRKVVCQIAGGLGNQLFMYATGQALAWRNGAELVADTGMFQRDTVYGREWLMNTFRGPRMLPRWECPSQIAWFFRRVRLRLGGRLPGKWRRTYIEPTPARFQPEVFAARGGRLHLVGCWQSERYFEDCRARLLEHLAFVDELSLETLALAAEIAAEPNPVAVHLRSYRDVPNPTQRLVLPWSYTAGACARIRAMAPDAKCFLFADEPEQFREASKALGPCRWATHNHARGNPGAVEDLYLMSRCRHFVVANSSLSWWGAWLSQQCWGLTDGRSAGDRMVFAPDKQLFNSDFVPAWWEALAL